MRDRSESLYYAQTGPSVISANESIGLSSEKPWIETVLPEAPPVRDNMRPPGAEKIRMRLELASFESSLRVTVISYFIRPYRKMIKRARFSSD